MRVICLLENHIQFEIYSRFSNTSQPDNVQCRQLLTSESFDYSLSNACEGYFTINTCPPIYISVQIAPQSTQSSFQCSEPNCRFPDEVKVNINLENLGCYSNTAKITCQLFVVAFGIFVHFLFQKLRA